MLAKWDLRRMQAHRHEDVPVIHLFTLADLRYPTGWNTKGLLQVDEHMGAIRKAAQTLFVTMDGRWTRA